VQYAYLYVFFVFLFFAVAEVASDYGFVLNPERDVCFKGALVKRLTENKIVFKERKKEYL